jgi:hypothetical protein
MVGTGLLLIRGEEAFAEETYSPNPFMNAGSLAALFAADILIRRSSDPVRSKQLSRKDIVSRVLRRVAQIMLASMHREGRACP